MVKHRRKAFAEVAERQETSSVNGRMASFLHSSEPQKSPIGMRGSICRGPDGGGLRGAWSFCLISLPHVQHRLPHGRRISSRLESSSLYGFPSSDSAAYVTLDKSLTSQSLSFYKREITSVLLTSQGC